MKTCQAALDEIGRSYFDMVIAEACAPAVDGCARKQPAAPAEPAEVTAAI